MQLEQVDIFPYLGSLIMEDAEDVNELTARLSEGQVIRASLKQLWNSHRISTGTKIILEKSSHMASRDMWTQRWTIRKNNDKCF